MFCSLCVECFGVMLYCFRVEGVAVLLACSVGTESFYSVLQVNISSFTSCASCLLGV